MFRKRTLYDILKLRILLYFIPPVILTAAIIFTNHQLNSNQVYKMYNDFYVNYTDEVFYNIDKKINTIVRMDYWLKNENVRRIFESNSQMPDPDIRAAMEYMRKMKSDFDSIDSILIVNRKSDYVVATNGKATIDRYFDDVFDYKDYDASYFRDIRYPADSAIKLPPTAIEGDNGGIRYVLPIVKMAAMNENPNSFFIFNISLDKLIETYSVSKYTSNTSFWFLNKKDRQFYSAGGNVIQIDDKIWDKITFDNKLQTYEDNKGRRYSVITKTISPNLMDYAYVVFIPVEDVDKAVSDITIKIVVISLLIYIVFVMIILFTASDIGKIFVGMIKQLDISNQVKLKEVFRVTDKISKEFSKILDENNSMKLEMKNMMGDVKEKMISDVLNNKNRQVKISLYKYDNFLPVVFRIVPTLQMKEDILLAIEESLYTEFCKYFDGRYETFDITNMNGDVRFVLNVPQNLKKDTIEAEINQLISVVLKHELNVELKYSVGDVCNSFEKLRAEYLKLSGDIVEKDNNTNRNKLNYIYRMSENNAIINSILEGDYDKTIMSIDRILITNIVNDVSYDAMKLLYQNIINTMITALKMKKIDVDNLISETDEDTYLNIGEKTEDEIAMFIIRLVDLIRADEAEAPEETLASEIIRYIDENFCDYSLTLENVAEHFGVDAKKLSKLIKKTANITFHRYLTELRIEEAKRLLITTDLRIEQIYTNVGYVSRTTFIRAFDSVEKITPSEYRKKTREQ